MTDRTYLIPVNGVWLALDPNTFAAAVAAGAQIVPGPSLAPLKGPETAELLTAERIGELTGVAPSWFLMKARLGEIPHVKLGKFIRFNFADVTARLSRGADVKS